jgi:hypothetical protein
MHELSRESSSRKHYSLISGTLAVDNASTSPSTPVKVRVVQLSEVAIVNLFLDSDDHWTRRPLPMVK